jgi:hypothetical protein
MEDGTGLPASGLILPVISILPVSAEDDTQTMDRAIVLQRKAGGLPMRLAALIA